MARRVGESILKDEYKGNLEALGIARKNKAKGY